MIRFQSELFRYLQRSDLRLSLNLMVVLVGEWLELDMVGMWWRFEEDTRWGKGWVWLLGMVVLVGRLWFHLLGMV